MWCRWARWRRALKAGIPADQIVFAGVGKTELEMEASRSRPASISSTSRSFGELETLNHVAARMGVQAPVTLRINPDVDAKTHSQDLHRQGREQVRHRYRFRPPSTTPPPSRMKGIRILGLAVHIGSQLTDIAPYRAAFLKIAELAQTTLRKAGHDRWSASTWAAAIGISPIAARRPSASERVRRAGAARSSRPLGTQIEDRAGAQHRRRRRPAGLAGHQREGRGQSQDL